MNKTGFNGYVYDISGNYRAFDAVILSMSINI